MKKIDFTLIKSLVSELESLSEGINLEPKDADEKMKSFLELTKASGLAAYIYHEAAGLVQDVAVCIKSVNCAHCSVEQEALKQETIESLFGKLSGAKLPKGNN